VQGGQEGNVDVEEGEVGQHSVHFVHHPYFLRFLAWTILADGDEIRNPQANSKQTLERIAISKQSLSFLVISKISLQIHDEVILAHFLIDSALEIGLELFIILDASSDGLST
jgi:hypothetical protein